MFYIVATPIGNLSDITLRALEVLKTSDLILCEDTRTSKVLLAHYGIQTQVSSYHSFNETSKKDSIIKLLLEGKTISLISDAGMPLIQDPGHTLVEACQDNNIPYTVIPGASSVLNAAVLSGFEVKKFQFIGFLPKKNSEIKPLFEEALGYDGLSIFFESPKRLIDSLSLLAQLNQDAPCCVIREITKKFETVHKGSASSLLCFFKETEPRGEIVLILKGQKTETNQDLTEVAFELVKEGLSKKTAYSILSQIGFVNKKKLYHSSEDSL